MSSNNTMASVSHLYFLGLSAVGYSWLWGRIVCGPGMKAIIDTRTTGFFYDGTLLTQKYTGLRPLDAFFVPAVIFYNDLLSSNDPVYRMLLIDIFSTMQTTSHCMSVVGWERGKSSLLAVIENIFWGVLNQAWGAATVYPIYCFAHVARWLQTPNQKDFEAAFIGPKALAEALPLPAVAIVSSLTPLILFYPAMVTCSAQRRQIIIAMYRLTPPVLAFLRPAASAVLRRTWVSGQGKDDRVRAQRLTAASLAVSGATATLAHWYAIGAAVWTPGSTLARVFLPTAFTDGGEPTLRGTILAEAAHEFLQWDVIAVGMALTPLSYLVWKSQHRKKQHTREGGSFSSTRRILGWGPVKVLSWGFGCVVLSPGGLLAWTLAARVIKGLMESLHVE
ncbi:hypothetical protein PspLS_12071 [Pyricularia sp. CBS 133598]|nr:hypothetical protein PspLS_12071 [Pyricularia sp. CBS 133598]